jgi:hypothetical protein
MAFSAHWRFSKPSAAVQNSCRREAGTLFHYLNKKERRRRGRVLPSTSTCIEFGNPSPPRPVARPLPREEEGGRHLGFLVVGISDSAAATEVTGG